jgi:hypothetical protein
MKQEEFILLKQGGDTAMRGPIKTSLIIYPNMRLTK